MRYEPKWFNVPGPATNSTWGFLPADLRDSGLTAQHEGDQAGRVAQDAT
jgi:hypothetical protein